MSTRNLILLAALGVGIWYLMKRYNVSLAGTETGLGAAGIPRRGRPKTEEERRMTHLRRFGTTELPPRGTGLRRRGLL